MYVATEQVAFNLAVVVLVLEIASTVAKQETSSWPMFVHMAGRGEQRRE